MRSGGIEFPEDCMEYHRALSDLCVNLNRRCVPECKLAKSGCNARHISFKNYCFRKSFAIPSKVHLSVKLVALSSSLCSLHQSTQSSPQNHSLILSYMARDDAQQRNKIAQLCYDRPSWNDARLYHGDITEFLELEYR
ncbi:hypothetical protein T4B_7313 [Trichinella pseudospiralis]|uniref:Uncharacterized protein n=1 Tax=Trichinella pseudospiralis TaxID=6337 RepID=A0A0V1HM13_TRIPS|nr:hypothetical protein T4B_7313 [Trichinella pseudospiralis]